MVDINLFKDDESEEKEWTSESGQDDSLGEEEKEDFNFDEDLSELDSSKDDELLSADDAIPDFDEPVADEEDEDYEFGELSEKKTPIWLWALLGVLVVVVFLYLFVIQPRQAGLQQTASTLGRNAHIGEQAGTETGTDDAPVTETAEAPVETIEEPTDAESKVPQDRVETLAEDETLSSVVSVPMFVRASKAILEELSGKRQFGAVLLTGDRFFVEYVAERPNVSDQLGRRIQQLVGASSFVASPEERYRRGGQVRYSGVVSGKLSGSSTASLATEKQFASEAAFISAIRKSVREHQMQTKELNRLSQSTDGGKTQVYLRMKIEGERGRIGGVLDGVQALIGNSGLIKLLLVPAEYSDYQASRVKLVLDLLVAVG